MGKGKCEVPARHQQGKRLSKGDEKRQAAKSRQKQNVKKSEGFVTISELTYCTSD